MDRQSREVCGMRYAVCGTGNKEGEKEDESEAVRVRSER